MKISKVLLALLLPIAILAGCGGGSSSTTAPTPVAPVIPVPPVIPPVIPPVTPPVAAVKPITVVPALGAFGAGATVAFIKPDGSIIASATTGATGAAVVDMGTYSGPFISRVTGGPGVTFYNEKTLGRDAFGATDTLLAIVPSVPTGSSPSLGVTALTNAAAAVLVADPASPKIAGTDAATIKSQIAVANATVAVAAGLPAGVDMLSAPQALSSPTDKITSTNPAAVAYGAYLAALAQAAPTSSILASVKAMATDAKANNGALPATSATFISAATNLAAVVAANVATSSQSTSLTALTVAFKPDPALTKPESKAAVTAVATTNNGGTAPTTPVVTPPVVTPPVVTPPVVTPAGGGGGSGTRLCPNPNIYSGTFTLYLNGETVTGSIVNGILYANDASLNATGAGSGVISGTVSGSSGGSDGYVLSSGLQLLSGSASGSAIIMDVAQNITVNSTSKLIEFSCP